MHHVIKISAMVLGLMLFFSGSLQAQMADTSGIAPKKSPGKAVTVFLAPTVLIGAGIATMQDRLWYDRYDAYECIQRNYPDFHTNVENYLLFLPAATVYGLNLAGVKGKNNFVDRSVVYLVSLTLAGLSCNILKSAISVERPDGSDDRSFPSSHTALAFVSATFLHEEYKDRSPWYSIAGYTVATATGVLRMMNNEHWLSDVLAGAGLGILTTKIVYWVDPLLRKREDHLTFLPYALPNHFGVFMQYTFR